MTTKMPICNSMTGQFSLTNRVETLTIDEASWSLSLKQKTVIPMTTPSTIQMTPMMLLKTLLWKTLLRKDAYWLVGDKIKYIPKTMSERMLMANNK
jgi:hypothetical protein